MPAKIKTLKLKRAIAQPASDVYRALTRASALRAWMCDAAQVDARKTGRLYVYWNDGYYATGQFTTADPDRKLAFTWHGQGEPEASRVQITLKEKGGQTTVTLTHTLGSGKAWAEAAKGLEAGWVSALENLQSVLETGEDLRIMRRPMLGIMGFSELDDETAARLGTPVKRGIRIGGTVEGMGAHAAGLRADDVLVSIGKTKLTHNVHIPLALQPHHAGDTLPVTFYRGAEKMTLPMTLSRRPLPALPATAAELAEQMRQNYARDEIELAKLFEGASEDEAGRRPEPKEWSAKEVLTHLITSERGTTDFISETVTDSERWYDNFDNDVNVYPAGLLKTYPTVSALLNALKQAEAETVAVLESLPPDYLARKRNYWRLCFGLLQGPSHVVQHLDQIRNAIASARP